MQAFPLTVRQPPAPTSHFFLLFLDTGLMSFLAFVNKVDFCVAGFQEQRPGESDPVPPMSLWGLLSGAGWVTSSVSPSPRTSYRG